MFERTLQDVVRGLRAQPTSEGRNHFASVVLQECRQEAKSTDGAVKSQAVLKIAHLRMLGYDTQNTGDDDTSFHVIETMALPVFRYKRIGYLAASQLLTSRSPVLLLATNSLKKELQANDVYIVGLALGSCSSFISKEMARDLLQDVITVTASSTKPYVRKRGTLCLYKMCVKFPEAINLGAFDALRNRLDDADSSVVSCAVNAICELAKVNPKNVLPLTPQLFSLLTTSGNNWLTIKVVKLYASLLRIEPRLGKKLLDPLTHIVQTTPAKSLLYEGIATLISALTVVPEKSIDADKRNKICLLCAKKLKEFVNDTDQNLKYLGLTGFIELTKAATPSIAACLETKEIILCCLNDEDSTVRLKALELLSSMSTKQTVRGIVSRLLEFLPQAQDKPAIVRCIVLACVDAEYSRVPSCEWLFAVLLDLARLGGGAQGDLLARQICELVLRVPSVRDFASRACAKLFLERKSQHVHAGEILRACAFVCTEFDCMENANEEVVRELLRGGGEEEEETACVFALSAFKLAKRRGMLTVAQACAKEWLEVNRPSSFRVRDRLLWCLADAENDDGAEEDEEVFGPVHEKAQRHVPRPAKELFAPRRVGIAAPPQSLSGMVSFRGRVEPITAASAVQEPAMQSFSRDQFYASGMPYAPPPRHAFVERNQDDISPFLLSKKRSNQDEQEADDSDDMDETVPLKPTVKQSLWSTSLESSHSTHHSHHTASSLPVVVLAPIVEGGEYEEGEEDEAKKRRRKRQGGEEEEMTLADVELDLDAPYKQQEPQQQQEEEEVKQKKKKSKDKKKKKKSKDKAADGEEDLMNFAEF